MGTVHSNTGTAKHLQHRYIWVLAREGEGALKRKTSARERVGILGVNLLNVCPVEQFKMQEQV